MSEIIPNELTSNVIAVASLLTATFSALCAFLSFQLAKKMRAEIKSDERLIFGEFGNPHLQSLDHSNAVVTAKLFNKSHRKAYINKIEVYTEQGEPIGVDYSVKIDTFGNPINPSNLIGVVDAENVYIRRSDGNGLWPHRIEIFHSFSKTPLTIICGEDGDEYI